MTITLSVKTFNSQYLVIRQNTNSSLAPYYPICYNNPSSIIPKVRHYPMCHIFTPGYARPYPPILIILFYSNSVETKHRPKLYVCFWEKIVQYCTKNTTVTIKVNPVLCMVLRKIVTKTYPMCNITPCATLSHVPYYLMGHIALYYIMPHMP